MVKRLLGLLCFLNEFLMFSSWMNMFKCKSSYIGYTNLWLKNARNSPTRLDQEDDEFLDSLKPSNRFIPRIGLESKIAGYGDRRSLSLQEYILAFKAFPTILKANEKSIWPEGRDLSEAEITTAAQARTFVNGSLDSTDNALPQLRLQEVQLELQQFHKYLVNQVSINKKSNMEEAVQDLARQYNRIFRYLITKQVFDKELLTLLSPTNQFNFQNHIIFDGTSNRIACNASSLWMDCLQQYFGLSFLRGADTVRRPSTEISDLSNITIDEFQQRKLYRQRKFDPRYYLKQQYSETTRTEIRDVLINILRYTIYTVFDSLHTSPPPLTTNNNNTISFPRELMIVYPSFDELTILHDYQEYFPSMVMMEVIGQADFILDARQSSSRSFSFLPSDGNDLASNEISLKKAWNEENDHIIHILCPWK